MKSHLLIGTKKGLFIATSANRAEWEIDGPFLRGKEVNHAIWDGRTRTIYATGNDAWFGCEIMRSNDFGKTWQGATRNPAFPADGPLKLERIWHLEAGIEDNVLWAGIAPAGLFRSADGGVTWDEIKSLNQHPTRDRWFPGAGGMCLHSIVLDPKNAKRMFAGISAAGVFRTTDGGESWTPANRGTRAEFMPDKFPELGQCVHKLLASPANPRVLYQQNHCGVYRSDNDGESWTEITKGLPSDFGFPLGLHPRNDQVLYVIPLQGGEFRCPPEGRLAVYKSSDGGQTWVSLRKGLPQENAYFGVLRDAMSTDAAHPAGVYFGTNTGKVFNTSDEGETWRELADNLPPVYSVHAFQA